MNAEAPRHRRGAGFSDPRANHISAASPAERRGRGDVRRGPLPLFVRGKGARVSGRDSPCLARRECGSLEAQNAGADESVSDGPSALGGVAVSPDRDIHER